MRNRYTVFNLINCQCVMNVKIILSRVISGLSCIVPTKKIITFCSFPDYTDNPYAVFTKMYYDERYKNYMLVWLLNGGENLKKMSNIVKERFPKTKVVSKKSLLGFYYLLISRYHICSHGLFNMLFFHHKKPKIINLWHGMPLKVIGAMDHVYGTTYDNSDLLIATNEFYADIMSRSLKVEKEHVKVFGLPRNDLLFEKTDFYDIYGIDRNKYNSIGAWLPTFRKNADKEDRVDGNFEIGKIDFFDLSLLNKLNKELSDKRNLLIVKLHPMDAANDFIFPSFSNILIINKKSPRFQLYPFLGSCDYLLTDFSSVFVDFDILRRPMGFVISDLKQYKEARGFIVEDVESFLPGNIIANYEDFLSFINTYRERYIETNSRYNKFKDANSTKRLLDYLYHLL